MRRRSASRPPWGWRSVPASLTLEHDAFQLWVTVRVGGQEHLITAIQDEIELVSRVV